APTSRFARLPVALRKPRRRRSMTEEQPRDADVFVDRRPLNADALADESPSRAFGARRIRESREPAQRHSQLAAIDQLDAQLARSNRDPLRTRRADVVGALVTTPRPTLL